MQVIILTIDSDGQARAFEAIGARTLRDRYERLRKVSDSTLDGDAQRFEVAGVSIDVMRLPEAKHVAR